MSQIHPLNSENQGRTSKFLSNLYNRVVQLLALGIAPRFLVHRRSGAFHVFEHSSLLMRVSPCATRELGSVTRCRPKPRHLAIRRIRMMEVGVQLIHVLVVKIFLCPCTEPFDAHSYTEGLRSVTLCAIAGCKHLPS